VIEGGGVGRRIIPGTQALEDAARQDILAVLERYRRANEARDFAAIQQVWPGVNTNVRGTLNDVSAIQLTFLGEPAIDLQLAGGMARVAVPMRIVEVRGSDKRARDTIATISLSNVNASRQWVITGVTHKPAE
jgi:hypothetical protein